MKYVLFALLSLSVAQAALAQSVPVPRFGSCPTGTSSQGGSCVPQGRTQVFVNGDGPCPLGWTRSARFYCVR
jgi:hypothetical protein